jgi:hypothetical protein
MSRPADLVFVLDVDNTLLNNDEAKAGISARVEQLEGPRRAHRFWELYELVRDEKGYVDFPTTVVRLAEEEGDPALRETLSRMLDNFPFRDYLYPHALDTIAYLNSIGEATVVSDGDPAFQPHKIKESGIAEAVNGRVLVVVHKEEELDKVFGAFPARHYVAIDDKPRIISALERYCPTTFTTILVEQGKYAAESRYQPIPDITVASIADVRAITRSEFLHPHTGQPSTG